MATLLDSLHETVSSVDVLAEKVANATKFFDENRYNEICRRLFAAKESISVSIWQMVLLGSEIPLEDTVRFTDIQAPFQRHRHTAETILRKMGPQEDGVTLRKVLSRLRYHRTGFHDLQRLMNAIDAMAGALEILGEALSTYEPPSSQQPVNPRTQDGQQVGTNVGSMASALTRTGETPTNVGKLMARNSVSLASLSEQCLEGLDSVCEIPRFAKIRRYFYQLTLFTESILKDRTKPLEAILDADPEKHKDMRYFITKCLVNIAVDTGKFIILPIHSIAPISRILGPSTSCLGPRLKHHLAPHLSPAPDTNVTQRQNKSSAHFFKDSKWAKRLERTV